jgi:hypothetical protein
MGLNNWSRRNPIVLLLAGLAVVGIGAARGQPLGIAIGVGVVLLGIGRIALGL